MAHQVLSFTWLLYEGTPQIFDQPVRIWSIHDQEDAAQPKKGILSRYDGKPFSQNHGIHQICSLTSKKKKIWSAKLWFDHQNIVILPSKNRDTLKDKEHWDHEFPNQRNNNSYLVGICSAHVVKTSLEKWWGQW